MVEINKSKTNDPETNNSETNKPKTNDPETNNSETNKPKTLHKKKPSHNMTGL